jgi:hypothetical protein
MKIGLIDVDGHHFSNLALMKLANYHRQQGDIVEWVNHFEHYDKVCQSKVFTSLRMFRLLFVQMKLSKAEQDTKCTMICFVMIPNHSRYKRKPFGRFLCIVCV